MPKRKSTKDRILDKIAAHNGVTSPGLLASDLRLSIETTKKHVRTLLSEGRVCLGWDGQALEISTSEARARNAAREADKLLSR